jgi:hypothetical protein
MGQKDRVILKRIQCKCISLIIFTSLKVVSIPKSIIKQEFYKALSLENVNLIYRLKGTNRERKGQNRRANLLSGSREYG